MENRLKEKIILFPVIVTLLVIGSIYFFEHNLKSELFGTSFVMKLTIGLMMFFTIYFFLIAIVVPLHFFISNKLGNTGLTFILFNIFGVLLIGCLDIWFFTIIDIMSIYLIFPLFSILAWLFK